MDNAAGVAVGFGGLVLTVMGAAIGVAWQNGVTREKIRALEVAQSKTDDKLSVHAGELRRGDNRFTELSLRLNSMELTLGRIDGRLEEVLKLERQHVGGGPAE